VVEYRPGHCAYCDADTWCELRANGKWQCRACKVERFFARVLYPPLGYELMWWQRKALRDLYGTVQPEDGRRQYRRAFISLAKQNGKTFLLGGLPLYNILMEDEFQPEAYGGAAAKEQAGLVFKAASILVGANPDLQSRLKVLPSTKRILRRDGGGFYAVLSADGDLQDGIRPSLSLRDELHRWKTARAETLRDVMTKGQVSRDEPLDIVITTAGAEYESPLWLEEYEHAERVLAGIVKDPALYVLIFEPDRKRLKADPDYWKSRAARVAANPSHEDSGGFLRDASIVAELDKALLNPRARSKYLRYHLNVPLKTFEEPVIDLLKWLECGGGVDLPSWERFDLKRLIAEWGLAGQQCWIGIDASWTTDLTAAVCIFPPFKDVEAWTIVPFFWMPQERVEQLERACRVPFGAWIAQGFLEATPGGAIDLRSIIERVLELNVLFNVQELAYDRMNFRPQAMDLEENHGIVCAEINQNFLLLSPPTKWLLAAYPEGELRHGNHPVMNWMASCLQLQYDRKDNCQPVKPERLKSSKRIDGFQALITALNRAILGIPKPAGPIRVW
jgi:phage terminase large subunit-like protein